MQKLGFKLVPGDHPIIPVMLGDAKVSAAMADKLLKEGIYVVSFSYPVFSTGSSKNSNANVRCPRTQALRPSHRGFC